MIVHGGGGQNKLNNAAVRAPMTRKLGDSNRSESAVGGKRGGMAGGDDAQVRSDHTRLDSCVLMFILIELFYFIFFHR